MIVTIAFEDTDDVDVDVCAEDDFDNNNDDDDEDDDEASDDDDEDDVVDVDEFCVKFVPTNWVFMLISVAICVVGVCSCCGMLLLLILSPLPTLAI